MRDGNALLLRIANSAEAVGAALDEVQDFLDDAGYGAEVAGRVMVVADEIVSNVARCAFPAPGLHQFSLRLTPECGRRLRLVVEDDGVPFDPTAAPAPDLDAPIEARDPGSLGIHLVRGLSLSVHYTREGPTNRLDVVLDAC